MTEQEVAITSWSDPKKKGCYLSRMHSPLKRGTLHKLIKQSGLTIEEFLQLLKDDP